MRCAVAHPIHLHLAPDKPCHATHHPCSRPRNPSPAVNQTADKAYYFFDGYAHFAAGLVSTRTTLPADPGLGLVAPGSFPTCASGQASAAARGTERPAGCWPPGAPPARPPACRRRQPARAVGMLAGPLAAASWRPALPCPAGVRPGGPGRRHGHRHCGRRRRAGQRAAAQAVCGHDPDPHFRRGAGAVRPHRCGAAGAAGSAGSRCAARRSRPPRLLLHGSLHTRASLVASELPPPP